ncbi:MAG: hypothetical protein H7Y18_02950 [Clostridiaceae bacterium]|nr:hypothetical protein [Clostridiaceae bacterium]
MFIYIKFEVLLQSISMILSLVSIIFLLLKGKKSLLTKIFIGCQSLVFIWAVGQIFEILSTSTQNKWICVLVESIGIRFIGTSWLFFSLIYANNKLAKAPKKIIILFSISFIEYFLLLTNPYHKLFYTVFDLKTISYGPGFWISIGLDYTFLITGTVILVFYSIKQMENAKKKSIILITVILIPVISNMLYVFRVVKLDIDITPISISISLFLLGIAVLKYRFLNIIPIALPRMINSIAEAIIVIDYFDTIIFCNDIFHQYFHASKVNKNSNINDFLEYLKAISHLDKGVNSFCEALKINTSVVYDGKICISMTSVKHFNVKIRPIKGNNNKALGRIVTFNDICESVNLLESLNLKNKELMEANDQLKKYAKIGEELAIAKERNRFAMDLHDTLGHTMTLLLKLNEASIITCAENPKKTVEILKETHLITKEGMKELRRSISGMAPGKLKVCNISESLKKLIYDYESSGMEVELVVDGEFNYSNLLYSDVIYRTCQEALTNSMRHGNSNKVNIFLKFSKDRIKLYIIDNGVGCKKIIVGYGLLGMKERIEKIKGDIIFGSDGESGFNIHVEIPVGDEL